jgi:hypothetical protein
MHGGGGPPPWAAQHQAGPPPPWLQQQQQQQQGGPPPWAQHQQGAPPPWAQQPAGYNPTNQGPLGMPAWPPPAPTQNQEAPAPRRNAEEDKYWTIHEVRSHAICLANSRPFSRHPGPRITP